MIVIAIIAITQFSAYKRRGYAAATNVSAKNAMTAAMAYCSGAGITTVATPNLAAGGYIETTGITAAVTVGYCTAPAITATIMDIINKIAAINTAVVLTPAAP